MPYAPSEIRRSDGFFEVTYGGGLTFRTGTAEIRSVVIVDRWERLGVVLGLIGLAIISFALFVVWVNLTTVE